MNDNQAGTEQTVARWMDRNPVTVTPEATVTDVASTMLARTSDHVVVLDSEGHIAGVVTAADLIAKHAQIHLPTYFSLLGYSFEVGSRSDERAIERALAATARDLMSDQVVRISPDADVEVAATLMLDHHVSFLPVVEDRRLVGVISERDIVRLLVVEEEQDAGGG